MALSDEPGSKSDLKSASRGENLAPETPDPFGIASIGPPQKAKPAHDMGAPNAEAGSFYPKADKTKKQILDPFTPPPPPPNANGAEADQNETTDQNGELITRPQSTRKRKPLSLQALFISVFLTTVAISLAVNWYIFGPEAAQILPPVSSVDHTQNRPLISKKRAARVRNPVDNATVDQVITQTPIPQPCLQAQYWSKPDVLFTYWQLSLQDSRQVSGKLTGVEGCNLSVETPNDGLMVIPINQIVDSNQI